jgi:hypothetical protein
VPITFEPVGRGRFTDIGATQEVDRSIRDERMRRLLLYIVVSVLMVAGEPAIGATLDLPPGPPALGSKLLAAPVHWIVSFIGSRFKTPAPPVQN